MFSANQILSNLTPSINYSIQLYGVCGRRANTLIALGYDCASLKKFISGKGAPRLFKLLTETHQQLHPSFSCREIANIVLSSNSEIQIDLLIKHSPALFKLDFTAQLLHDLALKSNNKVLLSVLAIKAEELLSNNFQHSDIIDIIYFCQSEKRIDGFLRTEFALSNSGFSRKQALLLLRYTENPIIVENISKWFPVLSQHGYDHEMIISHARDRKISVLSDVVRSKINSDRGHVASVSKRCKLSNDNYNEIVSNNEVADHPMLASRFYLSQEDLEHLATLPVIQFEQNTLLEQPFDQNNANTNVSEEGASLGSSPRHFGNAVNLFRSESPVSNCIQRHIIDLQTPTPPM